MYITKPLSIKVLQPTDNPFAESTSRGLCRKRSESKVASPKNGEMARRDAFVDDSALSEIARRINGFSGREISKLMMSLQTHILYSERNKTIKRFLSKALALQVVDMKVLEHERTADFQVSGYDYVHNESTRGTPNRGTPIITPNGSFQVPRLMKKD